MMCTISAKKFPVNKKSIQRAVDKFVKKFKILNNELSIAFVGNEEIKKLNKIYRNINKPTDVLSFGNLTCRGRHRLNKDLNINESYNRYAEIVISYPKAKEQAKKAGWRINDEILKLLFHALLHLIGYDHITEGQACKMEKMEEILAGVDQIKNVA